MRLQQGQGFLSILPGEILLSIGEISVGKVVVRVGRVGVRQKIELENLNRILDVSCALIVFADDVHGNFRPQLRLRIFLSSFYQLSLHLGNTAGCLKLV